MGKLKQRIEQQQENDFSFIYQERQQQYVLVEQQDARTWGKRDNIFSMGKPLSEMEYHKGKKIASARKQVQLTYGWMAECKDRRTRRVGKHWFKVIPIPRKTVLEQWELWKSLKFDPFINENDFKSSIWYANYDELTEEEIMELHDKIEKKYENVPDKPIYELHFKGERKYVSSINVHSEEAIWKYESPLEDVHTKEEQDYIDLFVNATDEQRKRILEDSSVEIKMVRMQKQRTKDVMCSIFLTYRYALRTMKQYTENREKQYLLTNPVYVKSNEQQGRRITERITEYHMLFCDVDFYSEHALPKYRNMKAHEIEKLITAKLESVNFPKHAVTISGGKGIQLEWLFAPIAQYKREEWRFLMKYLHELLSEFGADPNALDDVRILRAVGSIHEKTGKKVVGTYHTSDRFIFDEVFNNHCSFAWRKHLKEQEEAKQKALLEKEKEFKKAWEERRKLRLWMQEQGYLDENFNKTDLYDKSKRKSKFRLITDKVKANDWNYRHANMAAGIFWLTKVRKGNMEGHRTSACFLVRYYTLCIRNGDDTAALEEMRKLYNMFLYNEVSFEEMKEATNSAVTGYKRWVKNNRKGYNYKTTTLIKKFNISDEEMKEMRYIVTKERSQELKREYDRAYHEKNYEVQYAKKKEKKGIVSHDETRQAIIEETEKNPNLPSYKIAKLVKARLDKCSKNTVEKVWKEIGKEIGK
ncbi:hypothetical protein OCD81_27875 [Bacillus paranthracis]|uniref:hypothetical protein n=1 Tax=Bacillus paranthracis TaxID=2026186 RepID=UPI0021D135C0|nr:hypothetical protein [Bacillus paranthracis]MCU4954498.1 hypothetical protein [Bacillus paranthracis]